MDFLAFVCYVCYRKFTILFHRRGNGFTVERKRLMMDTIEDKLKGLILNRYKSIRQFSLETNIPNSTIETIFKRGLTNASISNVIRICDTLNISVDMLAQGEIAPSPAVKPEFTTEETTLIFSLRLLNKKGRLKVKEYMEDMIATGRYA